MTPTDFFEATGGLLVTGPTHTNVCDLRVVVTNRVRDAVAGGVDSADRVDIGTRPIAPVGFTFPPVQNPHKSKAAIRHFQRGEVHGSGTRPGCP